MNKIIKRIILAGIVIVSLINPISAKAYNVGGDDIVRVKSWCLNNFKETKDLWVQEYKNFYPQNVKGKFASGDFDGDGKDEFAAFYDYGSAKTSIFLYDVNESGKATVAETWTSTEFYGSNITDKIACGDFDGDGKDELVAMYNYGGNHTGMFIFKYEVSNGKGRFREKFVWESYDFNGASIVDVVTGDFDGNGKDEIAAVYSHGGNVTDIFEFTRESDSSFKVNTAWHGTEFNSERVKGKVVAGDYFGTGKDDIVMFYDYKDQSTSAWKFSKNNEKYSTKVVWRSTDFLGDRISDKITSTRYKDGRKDKIVSLYDYGNNITGIFNWYQSGNSDMLSVTLEDKVNCEADRMSGRVALGDFYGEGTQFISMYDGVVVKPTSKQELIVEEAKRHLNKAYIYGATGPNNFDCSGLTQYVYRKALGVEIGRNTTAQLRSGRVISSKNQLQPGDLVFPHSGHVGIYIGNGKMIHSPQTGDVVKVADVYAFYTARRII